MTGLTDFITTADWTDIFTIWFVLIDDAYLTLEAQLGRWRRRGPAPRFTDSEVITLALIIETFFHGNEELGLRFVRQYHAALFPHLLPNGQFNYRRRLLAQITELIRQYLIQQWDLISDTDRLRLLDSAPVPLTTYTRGKQCATVCEQEFFGVCPSKGTKYFGVKLFLTVTTNHVVDGWLLAPASYHDSEVMGAVLEDESNLTVLADGAFHKPVLADGLARRAVTLGVPPRRDSRWTVWSTELRALVGRLRRHVETTLSVLQTVFQIEQPGSHSADGLFARLTTKLLAYTLCFITQPLLEARSN
jgi:hypothetical protein